MDLWFLPGLLGGLLALVFGALFTKAVKNKRTNGELKYGALLYVLGLGCLVFVVFAVWAYFYDETIRETTSELIAVVGLFLGFGLGAIFCFGEYFKVKGHFDADGIEFYTPWTGLKKERWDDLVSAKFNASMYWYTFEFKSGKKVRLSSYLLGHGEVLALLKERGYNL